MADVDDLFVTDNLDAEDISAFVEADPEAPDATAEDVVGDVSGLVPLCVRHASGPQLTMATFGYDIAQMEKRPWAEPGAKLSDYFNYGFNEDSWRVYCAMQRDGEESLVANAEDVLRKMRLAAGGQPSEAVAGAGVISAPDHGQGPPHGQHQPPQQPPIGAYGSGARYGAAEEGGGYHGGYQGGGHGPGHGANYKTKICQRYQEGRCARGSECNYAHGAHELRPAPGGGMPMMGAYAPMGGAGAPRMEGQPGLYPAPSGGGGMHAQVAPHGYPMPYFQPGHGAPPVNFQPPEAPSADGRYLVPPKRPREEGY